MLKIRSLFFINLLLLFILSGCTTISTNKIIEDNTIIVPSTLPSKTMNGAIFQEFISNNNHYTSLFEDYRPHNIGDIMSIVLEENISASNSSSENISRHGNTNLGLTAIPGPFNRFLGNNANKTEIDGFSKNTFSGTGSNSAKNYFIGTITVTVKEVLSNGNLRVIGEKQIAINQGIEFIRFSGTVNPNDISKNNSVISTKVADSRIEYLSHGYVNEVHRMGWLQRLLLNIVPI
ncbi:flagellar basal body L-ring protein FlgH [Buchnera aphidicola (Hormaphis cornu)]|nr:flagellar basal body L-ring protein FlgH [Buchnera aphidicola (Hormaphis cornu)]